MIEESDVLTAREAGMFLGAHVETLRRLARRGQIPSFKIGKDWRFNKSALTKWADSHHIRKDSICSVLIIDDEEKICQSLGEMVGKLGCRGRWTTNGADGLKMLAGTTPDVVLLDLKMPQMSGPGFLKQLRTTHPNLPVVIITGYPDGRLMQQAMHYGPILLLAKPINREMLERAIRVAAGNNFEHAVGE